MVGRDRSDHDDHVAAKGVGRDVAREVIGKTSSWLRGLRATHESIRSSSSASVNLSSGDCDETVTHRNRDHY